MTAALAVAASTAWGAPAARVDLVGAARCVSAWLEAIASAAPASPDPRPRGGDGARWDRARALLAPAALAAASAAHFGHPLAPWKTLGRGAAFLGYELFSARCVPRGAAVVYGVERTVASPRDDAVERRCAWLAAPVAGAWRIVDARCGRDFGDDEVRTGYAGAWDDPRSLHAAVDPRPAGQR